MGGAEKLLLNMLSQAGSQDFNFFVLGLSENKLLLNLFKDKGVSVSSLNAKKSFSNFIYIFKEVYKFTKNNKINVIHAHMYHSMVIACMIKALNRKIKIVYTPHNIFIGSFWREIIAYLLRSFRDVDVGFSQNSVRYFYKSNYQLIPNGVDIQRYKSKIGQNNFFTFIAVGRLEPVKHHRLLIESVKVLKEKYQFLLYIIGDGVLRSELEALVKAYNAEAYVKLLGLRNDVENLLSQSSCFLMPSLYEGMPISLLEAGAKGLPIIATPVGDIPSLLDESCGYLSSETDFCKTMEYVINNYEEALMKARCFQSKIAQNFSIESCARKHHALYKKLCDGGV